MASTAGLSRPTQALPETSATPRPTRPVVVWASVGGLVLAFQAYVWIRWISGPLFKRVPTGPSDPPTYMKVSMIGLEILCPLIACLVFYRLVIMPWRRERTIGYDGLFAITGLLLWFQDPLAGYFGNWFSYNTYMVNFGSWVGDVPGWSSFASPGHTLAEPVLFTPFLMVFGWLGAAALGCKAMRAARRRRPSLGTPALIGICFVSMVLTAAVAEGCVFIPLGLYTYAGGPLAIFPSHYFKYPITESLSCAALITGFACLRFFTNDRGETLAERGSQTLRGGSGRTALVRGLAVFGAASVFATATFTIPASVIGPNSTAWPRDIQKRSYLLDGLCGDGTDRACPGPGIPVVRNGWSAHVTPDGRVVLGRVAKPVLVPFEK
jgi:Spirocyclase AveC-like